MLFSMWSDENYVYVATSSGSEIYDIVSEEKYAYINYFSGFTSTWASNEQVFLGTTASGIKYINKTCISGNIYNPVELSTCLNNFSTFTPYHNLTSDNIRYIHGNDDLLMCCTDLGIDVIKAEPQGYRSSTTISGGAEKCFMTQNGFYYTISGTNEWSLNRVDSCLCDWDNPNYSYITGSGILPAGEKINDIFVTENTSENGINNTIFCATSLGVYIIDEGTRVYAVYTTVS